MPINNRPVIEKPHIQKWFNFENLASISSTFYIQLLHLQILKALKYTDDLTIFFTLLGSTSVKAALKTLVKLTPDDPVKGISSSLKLADPRHPATTPRP